MNNNDSSTLNKINNILRSAVRSAIQEVNLGKEKDEQLFSALEHLVDIKGIYKESEEQLYELTVEKLEKVSLLDF